MYTHEYFMQHALREAQKAFDADEVPVGAVVVVENKIIARAHNQTETLKDPTAHAEMLAITSACNYMGAKYLPNFTLYVTLEPCVMCAGATFWAQIGQIVVGASDSKRGFSRFGNGLLHPSAQYISGIMAEESTQLLKRFFAGKR